MGAVLVEGAERVGVYGVSRLDKRRGKEADRASDGKVRVNCVNCRRVHIGANFTGCIGKIGYMACAYSVIFWCFFFVNRIEG